MRRGDIVVVADRVAGDFASKPRPAVVVQSERFNATGSLAVCPLTTVPADAPLLRLPVKAGPRNALRQDCWIVIEKLTCVRRERVRATPGRLTAEEIVALDRSLAVFLGFA
jgi:mRNA interferase MazF